MKKFDWFNACMRGADDLSHAEHRLLTILWSYSDAKGANIRPGRKRLIEESCIHRNSLDKCLNRLIELGYLVLVEQGGNQVKKGWANVYRLGYPHRLHGENPGDERVTPTVTLLDPQGSHSVGEGSHSVCTRVTPTVQEGSHSVGPHQVIDQNIDQIMDCVTTDSAESIAPATNIVALKDLDQTAYKNLLTWIQTAGEAMKQSKIGRVSQEVCQLEYDEAAEKVSGEIWEMFGEDFAEYFEEKFSIPAKAADRYEAGKWLKTFLRTAINDGRYFDPTQGRQPPSDFATGVNYELKVS
ncbi:hypothetical protein DFO66_10719 [Brevibacterium sanguinis]|uniref:Helix-turn-helix protein n=2 Tax=Brevibacterium TaxID=1696 RepID=A0A366IIC3_9MICO|nr:MULTISPECIES: hypothetical protein [Brevibacterium]RBP64147.1 hypothetical protein DFO66_10719 [Brevibacterium sanguinis]RBP71561.1 hypothetical protein DFO65_105165 [Brevibacterium celere]